MTQKKLDLNQLTTDQEFVMKSFSRSIGKVLSLLELTIPPGQQLDVLKKQIQIPLYDWRNLMLKKFTGYVVPESSEEKD